MTDKDSSDLDFVLEDPPTAPTADAAVITEEDSGIPETIDIPKAPEATDVAEDIAVGRPKVTRKKTAKGAESKQTKSRKAKAKKPTQATQTTAEPKKPPEDSSPALAATEDSSKPPSEAPASPQPPGSQPQKTADELPPSHPESRPVQPPVQVPAPEASGLEPERTDLVEPKEPVILGSGPLPQEMVHRWDKMLSTVSANTRNAIWEQGLQSMEELLRTARKDLVKPLGQLGADQCVELEAWLGRHGYKLPIEPQIKPFSGVGGRPRGGIATDVKTGAEVNNTAVRERRIKEMKAMRTGG